ncbi:MAG: hypothetical protein EBR82_69755, partial [Caulobacteraceae bacterium]|nr:hypothetical protein [Caulobacteraceae bacterium]
MTFTSDKLKQARDSGYSDDEIWGFVSQQDNRFNQAREAGYSLDEVSGFFSQQPTEQPITQPSVGGVPIPPAPEPLKVESPKLEEGMLRKAADIPIGILAGTAGTLKSVADVFGADSPASQQFADRERFWNNLISESGKEKQKRAAEIQQAAQDKGVWEQAKAAAQAFTEAPSLMLATGAGSLAPVIATGGAAQAVGG